MKTDKNNYMYATLYLINKSLKYCDPIKLFFKSIMSQ